MGGSCVGRRPRTAWQRADAAIPRYSRAQHPQRRRRGYRYGSWECTRIRHAPHPARHQTLCSTCPCHAHSTPAPVRPHAERRAGQTHPDCGSGRLRQDHVGERLARVSGQERAAPCLGVARPWYHPNRRGDAGTTPEAMTSFCRLVPRLPVPEECPQPVVGCAKTVTNTPRLTA